jgi:hypothetical protein
VEIDSQILTSISYRQVWQRRVHTLDARKSFSFLLLLDSLLLLNSLCCCPHYYFLFCKSSITPKWFIFWVYFFKHFDLAISCDTMQSCHIYFNSSKCQIIFNFVFSIILKKGNASCAIINLNNKISICSYNYTYFE